MAKKKISKKKSTKKTASKGASRSSSRTSKKAPAAKGSKKTVKKSGKKKVVKKTTSKKVVKKAAAKKKVVKKTAKKKVSKTTKKTAKKQTGTKAPAKKVAKKSTKKKTAKKTVKKSAPKSSAKPAEPTTTKADSAPAAAAKPEAAKGANAKGTDNKRRRSPKSKKPELIMPVRPLLLGPNGPSLKPLIPSGKNNRLEASVLDNVTSRRTKTPLTKTQLEKYRLILLTKRAELLGDMRNLEDEALRSDSGRSGSASKQPDEAGSESYEQSLNLNLAASDRERIIEIDAALERIENRTYGLCELTFEPIAKARLDEIPWTRYTIAAARELDRRGGPR